MSRSGSISSLDDPARHPLLRGVGSGILESQYGLVPVNSAQEQSQRGSTKSKRFNTVIREQW